MAKKKIKIKRNALTRLTVALISTVFLSWTVAQGQQTQKELGQTIFEILKSKNTNGLDSLTLTINEWTTIAKSKKATEETINQYKDSLIKSKKDLKDRFTEMLEDGEDAGIVWVEIILDSVQVSEYKYRIGDCLDCPYNKDTVETSLLIYFSYKEKRFSDHKERKFNISFSIFKYEDKWKINTYKPKVYILFSEVLTIERKIGN